MKWSEDDEKQVGELEPGGVYPFEISEADEKVSQKGNPYINLKLRVFVGDSERTIYDIIMPQMPSKLRSFCEALGLEDKLKARTLEVADCGTGEAFIRLSKKLDKNDRVQVEGYLAIDPTKGASSKPKSDKVRSPRQTVPSDENDEDIPF